jgi:Fe-S-cluster containining protein
MPDFFYQCQRCGNCCRWPGTVRLKDGEAARIAAHLRCTEEDFIEKYTELLPDRSGLGLKSRPNHECIFLEGANTCRIQAAKPAQCAGFPNAWNFSGWREVCEAVPVEKG